MSRKNVLSGPICMGLVIWACSMGPDSDDTVVEIRGGADSAAYHDFALRGDGLERFEGRSLRVQVGGFLPGLGFPERISIGRAPITGGAFLLKFPKSCENQIYKFYGGFIDSDGDGRCTAGIEPGFRGATGGVPEERDVEAWQFYPMDSAGCAGFQ